MSVLRDIRWYEKALNAVGGTAASLIRDSIDGLYCIPYEILDGIFGTRSRENIQWLLD